jgi:choline monooxygenase
MPASTQEILELLAQNASGSIESARSLPPAIYHSEEILHLETEHLFRQDWICLGRTAEMSNRGDYICRTIIDAPVFAVRQKDDSIRAFANVCVHRGAQLLCGDGHASRISCPYHSWTYDLDGQLVGAPFMDKTDGFKLSDYALRPLSCQTWEGFIYVSLNPEPLPIAEQLSELTSVIGDYRFSDYVPVFAKEESWETNWKCLVENFMDSYHIHRVHKNSFGQYGSFEDLTCLFPGGDAFAYHYIQETDNRNASTAHADNTWLQGDDRRRTYLINIFPGQVIQLQPDMLWYLSILPDGVDRLTIRWAVSIPREILDGAANRQDVIDETMNLLHQVNSEDQPIVQNVFASTRSPHAVQGPLSYLERNLWDFARYLNRKLNL